MAPVPCSTCIETGHMCDDCVRSRDAAAFVDGACVACAKLKNGLCKPCFDELQEQAQGGGSVKKNARDKSPLLRSPNASPTVARPEKLQKKEEKMEVEEVRIYTPGTRSGGVAGSTTLPGLPNFPVMSTSSKGGPLTDPLPTLPPRPSQISRNFSKQKWIQLKIP